jgi:hypothetical protein
MTQASRLALHALLLLVLARGATAQDLPPYDGPPPPPPGEVISRDEMGRATVRATRLTEPPRIDGALDEALYETVKSMSDFIQLEPQPGLPATEKTEVWLMFDETNLYIAVRCWDSDMRIVATEMRRDNNNIYNGNDMVNFMLDPFYDRRNSLNFTVNALAGRSEGQVTNERQYSGDWNPIWEVKARIFDRGWSIEAAIPFKSIRYGAGPLWGFNILRAKRSVNELSALTRLPPARGQQALQQASLAATVVGLDAPASSRPLDVKPYVTSSLTSDRNARPVPLSRDPDADIGLDAKYALTGGLTGDLTVHTDFAQVEADEQQVNLTRFSLFFPEKRDFFLENQGLFSFGGVPVSGNTAGTTDAPILFYSRRIGLNQNRIVPIDVGGRVTGRAGPWTIGFLDIQASEEEFTHTRPTNFLVSRLKRDILRKSSVGVIATGRSVTQSGTGENGVFGIDGTFGFFANLNINTYWARTWTDGVVGDDQSYRGQLDYTGDRYTVQLERLRVGDHFNPEVGFVRRDDMRRSIALFRFTPRLRNSKTIRKINYGGSLTYTENGAGHMESREQLAEFGFDLVNGDKITLNGISTYEFLPRPSLIGEVILPIGPYDFNFVRLNYNMAQQRPLAANITVEYGEFYNGRKTTLTFARGRVNVSSHLSLEPTYSINNVALDQGKFTTHVGGSRVTYTMTPLMFASALIQYNSSNDIVSVNARLRWEYRPGSELFVVYNEERNTLVTGFPDMMNRSFIVKVNRLFRF